MGIDMFAPRRGKAYFKILTYFCPATYPFKFAEFEFCFMKSLHKAKMGIDMFARGGNLIRQLALPLLQSANKSIAFLI